MTEHLGQTAEWLETGQVELLKIQGLDGLSELRFDLYYRVVHILK